MWDFLLKLLVKIFKLISPDMRKWLLEMLDKLEEMAKETPNPFDDFFVWLLKQIFAAD